MSLSGDTISLTESYQILSVKDIIQNPVGVWSPMSGMVMSTLNIWQRRQNLGGINLRAVTFDDAPFIHLRSNGPEGALSVSGFLYDIWHEFELLSNFRYWTTFFVKDSVYQVFPVPRLSWVLMENGDLTLVMVLLLAWSGWCKEKKSMLACQPLPSILEERQQLIS